MASTSNVEIKVYEAAHLDLEYWRKLQVIARSAFGSALQRSRKEIDYLVRWKNTAQFAAEHIKPIGQRFYVPRIAVALDANEPIGFASSARHVSAGPSHMHHADRPTFARTYLRINEDIVHPAYQNQGTARLLGAALLKEADQSMRVAAVIWPDELPFIKEKLEAVGFDCSQGERVPVFGENFPAVRQVTMMADSAAAVLRAMDARP